MKSYIVDWYGSPITEEALISKCFISVENWCPLDSIAPGLLNAHIFFLSAVNFSLPVCQESVKIDCLDFLDLTILYIIVRYN